jgi:cellulose synthase/poly-beta-1,6-N-acetylglucosamine synthase-like glycosyltransferase
MAYRGAVGAVLDRAKETVWTDPVAAPSIVPDAPGVERAPTPSRRRPYLPRCPEIDCVRDLLSPAAVALAELRAAEAGVGADRVLVTDGLIDEDAYLVALGRQLGIPFTPLDRVPRSACPLDDERLIEAIGAGMPPVSLDGDLKIVVTPRESTIRRLLEVRGRIPHLASRICLTSNARLSRFTARNGQRAIGYRAAESLRVEHPQWSASNARRRSVVGAAIAAAIALLACLLPGWMGFAVEMALGTFFLAWTLLRIVGMFWPSAVCGASSAASDRELPVYTIVVALYREAAAVKDLVASLSRLDYPPEKLDIKFVVEPNDRETYAALAALKLTAPFEIIVAPDVGPKTKPKALNAALPFARGQFVAVYDAEDRPEPDQLRLAHEAFAANDARLACVQARLTIDNTPDSWLTRVFTAEYAGLFDVFLPALADWRLPLPLGGSSNHFRTTVLREIGAWDPYNVTEDADLGMRIARRGYRTATIQSTTYEEAPVRFGPWLRQRTRWSKGWLQTWLVHMRRPGQLRRDLGWRGFVVFQLLVGGTVLAALVHSLFLAELLWGLAECKLSGLPATPEVALHATFLGFGYLVSIMLGVVGLCRRRLLGCAWALIFMPIYWVLLSIAAWRALFQLVFDPYRWEKTEHGLARSSRLAQQQNGLTNSAAAPPPPRQAGA